MISCAANTPMRSGRALQGLYVSPTSQFSTPHKQGIEPTEGSGGSAVVQRDCGSTWTGHKHLALSPGGCTEILSIWSKSRGCFHPVPPGRCPALRWCGHVCTRRGLRNVLYRAIFVSILIIHLETTNCHDIHMYINRKSLNAHFSPATHTILGRTGG